MVTRECSFEACQKCQHKECFTGQIAREKGKEAYDEFIAEMDKATDITENLDNCELTEEKIKQRKETVQTLAESAGIPVVEITKTMTAEPEDYVGKPIIQ